MFKLLLCGFLTHMTLVYVVGDSCNLEDLKRCIAVSPALLTSANVYYATTREEMDKNCVEVRTFSDCIKVYRRQCADRQTVMIWRTYANIIHVILSLCTPGAYQDEYLRHAHCVKGIRPEFENCSTKHQIILESFSERQRTEQQTGIEDNVSLDENLKIVCCSFQEYLACSEQTVQRSCGDKAALFTISILKQMSSNMMRAYCDQYDRKACGLGGKERESNFSSFVIVFFMLANIFGVAQKIAVSGYFTSIQSLEEHIFNLL